MRSHSQTAQNERHRSETISEGGQQMANILAVDDDEKIRELL